jgi:hypothetical protein
MKKPILRDQFSDESKSIVASPERPVAVTKHHSHCNCKRPVIEDSVSVGRIKYDQYTIHSHDLNKFKFSVEIPSIYVSALLHTQDYIAESSRVWCQLWNVNQTKERSSQYRVELGKYHVFTRDESVYNFCLIRTTLNAIEETATFL